MQSNLNGFTLVNDIIDKNYESELIKKINKEKWNSTLKRRTMHFGYEYNYLNKNLTIAPNIPIWALELCNMLKEKELIKEIPNQLIINEYIKGQGISKHIDSNVFDRIIFTISLLTDCKMIFRHIKDDKIYSVNIPARSFYIMEDEARYKWTHEIPNLISGRRISLTFRYVTLPYHT